MLESPFIKVARLRFATLLKRHFNTGVFLWNLQIFKNTYFVELLRMAASDVSESDESENDDESRNEVIQAVDRRCYSK